MYKKKMIKYCNIILIMQILISACNENNKKPANINLQMDYYSNGNIKKVNIENQLTHQKQTLWFDSIGNIDLIQKKKDTISEGQSIWFYSNGNIENTVIFKAGKKNGAAFMFYKDGEIKNHRYWKEDKRVGYASDFFQDSIGTLKNIYFYSDDKIEWWRPSSENSLGISVKPATP